MAVTLINSAIAAGAWAPGTRHYLTAEGERIAVTVAQAANELTTAMIDEALAAFGLATIESGQHALIVEPTTILACNLDGTAEDLTPLHTFDPGTSHDDALRLAGYLDS